MTEPQTRSNDRLTRLRDAYERRGKSPAVKDANSLFDPGYHFIIQQRQRDLLELLRRAGCYPLTGKRFLEVGCGSGGVLREFLSFGVSPESFHGVDLLHWRLMEARSITPQSPLVNADGRHLPYPDGCFDVVMQLTAFSSILDDQVKREVAAEMLRVLASDGLILWYDFWINPLNRETRGVRLAEIRDLFPHCRRDHRRITLAPPIARRLAPVSWLACYALEKLRIFNTHYLAVIRPEP